MGIPVMVMGASGSGKSASLRNFEADEVGIFSVAGKRLPFRKKLRVCNTRDYLKIIGALRSGNLKSYVIDDSQYLMADEWMRRANESGFQKFTDIGKHFYDLVNLVSYETPPDCIVYFLHHIETNDIGLVKAKTIGKLLDEKITLEGMFETVLLCKTDGKRHWFETNSDSSSTAKSPMEMFPQEIDNDLKYVDSTIRKYYGLIELENHEDAATYVKEKEDANV